MSNAGWVDIDFNSLGKILEKLLNNDEVKASPILMERLETALKFHQSLGEMIQKFFVDYDAMVQQVAELTSDPRVKIHGEIRDNLLREYEKTISSRYETLHKAGASATLIYRVAKMENIDQIGRLKLLRSLFGFSLAEAQAVAVEAEEETTT
jgi:hypothetical protein